MKQLQQQNKQNVDLLSAYFQHRSEPNYAWSRACSMFLALPGLRGFWPMSSVDYTAASRAIDLGDQELDLTDNNTVEFGYDSLAPYVHFTSANTESLSFADTGAGGAFDILGTETYIESAYRGLTIGAWMYFDNDAGALVESPMAKWNTTGNQRSYLIQRRTAVGGGTIRFFVSVDGTATTNVESVTVPLGGIWYFVVGRFNPSTELKLFVNAEENTNVVAIPAAVNDSTADFYIGRQHGATASYIDGRISLAFLCTAQLSDAIILSLFEQTRAMYNV